MNDDDSRHPSPAADRRAAQDAAAELSRMGIDPASLGLEPAAPPGAAAFQTRQRGDANGGPASRHRAVVSVDFPDVTGAAPGWTELTSAPGGVAYYPQAPAARPATRAPGRIYGTPAAGGNPTSPGTGSPAASQPEELLTATTYISRPLTETAPPALVAPARSPDWLTEPLEKVTTRDRPLLPPRWHRTLRAATLGLVKPGAAAAIERERELMARVRTRRREPAVVVFVSGKGGSGTTTAAAGIGLCLAAMRTDQIALVDARRGTTSLGRRLASKPAPTLAQLSEPDPALPQPLALRARGLLNVIDAPPWHSQIAETEVVHVLDRLREAHAFTLVDIGTDLTATSQAVLGRADQIVLITTTSQDAIDSTRIALGRIWEQAPHRLSTVVVAVTCLTSREYRHTVRRLHADLGLTSRIVVVPFDPALAGGGLLDPGSFWAPTAEAFLRLAAFVADPGVPDRELHAARDRRPSTP